MRRLFFHPLPMRPAATASWSMRLARATAMLPVILLLLLPSTSGANGAGNVAFPNLPAGFAQTKLAGGLQNPTVLAFAPNGDIFIGQQAGAIKIFRNGALLANPVITLNAEGRDERGLLGLALDPNFTTNGFMYVSYTTLSGRAQLSRFTVQNDSAALSSEVIYLTGDQPQNPHHSANDLRVGPDGKLWWSVGDNVPNESNGQTLTNIYGKMLRFNLDGTIPTDNPFLRVPGAVPAIYAYGLRNPFRFTFLPNGKAMTEDTGSNYWEELDTIKAGGNYGWNLYEGNCFSCGYINPTYAYGHLPTDAATSAIAAYSGSTFPNQYNHVVFIGDYVRQDIEAVTFDASYNTEVSQTVFDSAAGTIADLKQGPDGSLYFVGVYEGSFYKIYPVGPFPPTAAASASPVAGMAPLQVRFSSAGSSDPYGAALTYSWDFGDGSQPSTAANPTHTYSVKGRYTATLTVSNGSANSSATTQVVVGSTPPSASITSPAANSTYSGGSVIAFSGSASDAVDGQLPASAYTWQVDFYSNGVAQPFYSNEAPYPFYGPVSGVTSGSFQIPRDPSNTPSTFYRITLSVVDSLGIQTVVRRDIRPNTTTWAVNTSVAGAGYAVDGALQTGSYTTPDVVGVQHVLSGLPTQTIGSNRYRFRGWSDGSALTDRFTSNTNRQRTFTANYDQVQAALPSPWQSLDIGSPTVAGTTDYSTAGQTFYVDGSGADVWSTNDQFRYVDQPLNGDGTIIARLRYQTNTDPWAKAGLMIKESTATGSNYVNAFVTPSASPNRPDINGVGCNANGCLSPLPPVIPAVGNGVHMQWSFSGDTGTTSPAALAGYNAPNQWLKLQRAGNNFTTSFSTDGVTWTALGTTTVALGTNATVGMFVNAHDERQLSTVAFDNVQVSSGSPPPPPCPAGWSCADIGTATQGTQSLNSGTWTVAATGSDIWSTADSFHLVSQAITGDGTAGGRVTAQANTDPWAKAGFMLRQTTDPGSPYYFAFVTPSNGIHVQYRNAQGANAVELTNIAGAAPAYLQVARSGSTYTAYTSNDGATWSPIAGSSVVLNLPGSLLGGIAATAHNANASGNVTLTGVSVSQSAPPPPNGCPAGWSCGDIGNPAPAGSQTLASGAWSITAGGADIWSTADQFHLVSQALAADGSISAHVTAQTNTDPWAKAGLMIRQSTDPGSPYYFVFVTPGNGIHVQYRLTQGANAQEASSIAGTVPAYVQVTRAGSTFTAYSSADGVTWTLIPGSSTTVNMTGGLLRGMAVTSHSPGVSCTAGFDSVVTSP